MHGIAEIFEINDPNGAYKDPWVQEVLHTNGFHGFESKFGLTVTAHDEYALVVQTELPDNPGTSVTNMAEDLATLVLNNHPALQGYNHDQVYFVEHYAIDTRQQQAGGSMRDKDFDLIEMQWEKGRGYTNPNWIAFEVLPQRRDDKRIEAIQKEVEATACAS